MAKNDSGKYPNEWHVGPLTDEEIAQDKEGMFAYVTREDYDRALARIEQDRAVIDGFVASNLAIELVLDQVKAPEEGEHAERIAAVFNRNLAAYREIADKIRQHLQVIRSEADNAMHVPTLEEAEKCIQAGQRAVDGIVAALTRLEGK